MNNMTLFVAYQIIRHVQNGGFIGASWPLYIAGADHRDCDTNAAITVAAEVYPLLWQQAEQNFAALAAE